MPDVLVGRAPAKLNLVLEVTGKREDGYHEIDTIFQELDLSDEVRVRLGGDPGITIEGPFAAAVPLDETNLALRAAEMLGRRCGRPAEQVAIRLVKQIPAAGGLGGGASDAATVLRLLQEAFGASEIDLVSVANSIGSDEAFFLQGGTARGRGRGERVQTLPPLASHGVVLFVPRATIERKTERMFAALDRHPFDDGGLADSFARRGRGEVASHELHNAFERVACDVFKGLQTLWSDLESRVGQRIRLCGAGPTLFWIGSLGEVADVASAAEGARCTIIPTATASRP